MRTLTLIVAGTLLVWSHPAIAHLAEGTVTLTAAAEVPSPVGVPANAGGTATLELEDDMTLVYELTVHDLTGPALLGHIHEGPPGTALPDNIVLPLNKVNDTTFMGTTRTLTADEVTKLLNGAFYLNVHTAMNPAGEIRGQIDTLEAVRGICSCQTLTRKEFRKCVNGEIKKLEKAQRRSAEVKALRRAVAKSACGLTEAPRKKPLACCLPVNDVAEIVTGKLCAPVKKDTQCTKLGGELIETADCVPNPCDPPASPSGAFVD